METKLVHGHLLEKRTCICGCGQDFWTMPQSPARHACRECRGNEEFAWGPQIARFRKRRRKERELQKGVH